MLRRAPSTTVSSAVSIHCPSSGTIARRPRSSGSHHHSDHGGAASRSLRVDELKAAVAPSLSPPRSAHLRSDNSVSLAHRSSFTTIYVRVLRSQPSRVHAHECRSGLCAVVSRGRWTAASRTMPSAALVRDLRKSFTFLRSALPTCADRLTSCLRPWLSCSSGSVLSEPRTHLGIREYCPPFTVPLQPCM